MRMLYHIIPMALIACGDSGEESAATSSAPTPATTASTTTEMTTASDACPIAGVWTLDEIQCSGPPPSDQIFSKYSSIITEVMEQSDGDCFAELILTSPYCEEREEQDITVPAGATQLNSYSFGVTACAPVGCQFGEKDIPCQLGDRSGSFSASLDITSDGWSSTQEDRLGFCDDPLAEVTLVWVAN